MEKQTAGRNQVYFIFFIYFIANVTFEPECRNNWHIHHSTKNGGQIVIFWSDWRKNEYENFYR